MNVLMVNDGNGALRPAEPGEEGLAVAQWSLADVRSHFGAKGGGNEGYRRPPEGQYGGACGPGPAGYMDPGSRGACAPRGQGTGFFGTHTNATAGTSTTSTTVSPQRPVRITQLYAYGPNLENFVLETFRINQDVIKHGGRAPASIFSPSARYPVEFALGLTTADSITIGTSQIVSVSNNTLMIGAANCFRSDRGLDYPCEPITAKGSRQIILGMGVGAPAEGGTGSTAATTIADSPDAPIRLGRLELDAVLNGTNVDATPRLGVTATNGMRALEFVEVRNIDLNGVTIFTTVPTNGAICGGAFGSEAGGVFFPDIEVDQSHTINVGVVNRAVAGTGTIDNLINVIGAFVGCELIGCAA